MHILSLEEIIAKAMSLKETFVAKSIIFTIWKWIATFRIIDGLLKCTTLKNGWHIFPNLSVDASSFPHYDLVPHGSTSQLYSSLFLVH